MAVSYTHLRAHETEADRVCRLLLEKYNINISEYSLRGHATVGKLIDSIWSEHIKYAL